jgi:hypothetical protein
MDLMKYAQAGMIQTPDDEMIYLQNDRMNNPMIGDDDQDEEDELFVEIKKSIVNRNMTKQGFVKNKKDKKRTYKEEYFLNIFKNDCIDGQGITSRVKICETCYVKVKMRK